MKIQIPKVDNFIGFSAEASKGSTVKVLTRAAITSDDPQFHTFMEYISAEFLSKAKVLIDSVHQFLVVIHADLSAELHINDFPVSIEIRAKRSIAKGEMVMQRDIADIRRLQFPSIAITETDKVIYCFKGGWRFGLFFDLTQRVELAGAEQPVPTEKLDVDKMMLTIGELYRYLSFYHVYKTLESSAGFEEMMKDGWFPFIELLPVEYKELSDAYADKANQQERVRKVIEKFDKNRIGKITSRWWENPIFAAKRELIEAGIKAYLQDTSDGFINSIKTLWSEVEGILREIYLAGTGKGNQVKSKELIEHLIAKAKGKTGSDTSLFLPIQFFKYLQEVAFANFDVEAGRVELSRHSSGHGVAKAHQYTKERALQIILVLDQIYFSG